MNTMWTAASDVDYDEATGNGDRWEREETDPEEFESFLIEAGLVPGPTDQDLEEWFSNDPRNQ